MRDWFSGRTRDFQSLGRRSIRLSRTIVEISNVFLKVSESIKIFGGYNIVLSSVNKNVQFYSKMLNTKETLAVITKIAYYSCAYANSFSTIFRIS